MTSMTVAAPPADPFRVAVDAIVDGDALLDLARVARILNAPNRDAIRLRLLRGTLPLRVIRPGGKTGALLVPAADLYALLGLEPTDRA